MLEPRAPFVISVGIDPDRLGSYPSEIPGIAARAEQPLQLHPNVTFLVGENGSGKSTLVEAVAIAAKLNPEGGSKLTGFATRRSHSDLHETLVLERAKIGPVNGFFLRAESFFNLATAIEGGGAMRMENVYARPLHEQSHGESFLSLALERFGPRGLYILDEPLSPRGGLRR